MTKVEELQERILSVCDVFVRPQSEAELIEERIADLISAAELQGMKKQQEQDAQYDKYEREAYEQAEKIALAKACSEGVAEGSEQERERIRGMSLRHDGGEYAETYGEPWYLVRSRTLSPTKEKP